MRPTRVRHIVLWLTVVAYLITYMDRVVISSAAPLIREEFGFDLITMGWILASFRWGYALFQIPGGWFGDRFGPRKALTAIVVVWSFFTAATALAWSAMSMAAFRFLFGLGEAGAFPTATRSLSRWMLPTERGFAQGVTHAGSRLGAALTPPIVVALMVAFGWRTPFFVFGSMGLAWAAVWYFYYRDTPDEHASVNEAERDLIRASLGSPKGSGTQKVPWRAILSSPTVRYLSLMYFCYGYCLAIYLDWFPTYLRDYRGYDLKQMGLYASLPLLAGVFGDLLGGWASDRVAHRTGNLKMARRSVAVTGFLLAAGGIIPAALTENPEACVAFSCLGFFGLELTVGVSWAIPLDIGGDSAGSVSAIMNTLGNVGGAISPTLLAYLVQAYGWNIPFLVASGLCITAAILFTQIDATKRIMGEGITHAH
ncbi:MAG: MFS transporter [Acidobacteria bacterium]|nr:MFS transporter [Acidobacteriota bacterium]MDA1236594.1 MFS transporter [Acidobacteriota bacterium]